MKKFVSILFVVLVALIMLCACDPTVGDDGGFDDDSFKQPQTVEEMTTYLVEVSKAEGEVLHIYPKYEYVEPCNEEAIHELFSNLEEYLNEEGFTAYPYVDEYGNLILRLGNETVEELHIFCKPSEEENVFKKYCPSMIYPKEIISDDEIVEYLNWLDENKTWEVDYSMATMEANNHSLTFIHRSDDDVATFKEYRSTNNATYRWMNKDKTIVEITMYNGRGRTYSYRCVNIPKVIEECKKLAEASVKADYDENWRDYPVGLYTFDEFMGAVNDMGGQSAVTVYTSTFVVPMMRPIWDEEGWSMCTSFNRVTDHVIEFVRNGSYYYAVVGEEGLAEARAIVKATVINTYEKYTNAIENVGKSDATGSVAVAYVNKNTPWGCDLGLNNSYATPEFFATVDEAVKFDDYTVKVKMKDEPLEYVYIYNSKHSIPAIEDADLIYKELN